MGLGLLRRVVIVVLLAFGLDSVVAPVAWAQSSAEVTEGRSVKSKKRRKRKVRRKGKKRRAKRKASRKRKTRKRKASRSKKKRKARRRTRRKAASAKRAKSQNKRRRAKKSRRRKVRAKHIRAWQKRGLSDRQILRRVVHYGGFPMTQTNRRALISYKVRRGLRVKLVRLEARRQERALAQRNRVNLNAELDPDDIDFDSVAPPENMDMEFADLHRQEAQVGKKRARKRMRKRRAGKRVVKPRRTPIRPGDPSRATN